MCDSHHVNEEVLERTYEQAMRRIIDDTDEIVGTVQECIDESIYTDRAEELARIESEIVEVQTAAVKARKDKISGAISESEYESIIAECKQKIEALEAEQQDMKSVSADRTNIDAWLQNFKDAMATGDIIKADNGFIMKQLVAQIIIHNDRMEIRFKCGVAVEEKYVK